MQKLPTGTLSSLVVIPTFSAEAQMLHVAILRSQAGASLTLSTSVWTRCFQSLIVLSTFAIFFFQGRTGFLEHRLCISRRNNTFCLILLLSFDASEVFRVKARTVLL